MDTLPDNAVQASNVGPVPRILVVDDDAAIGRMVRSALVTEGFHVTVAADGRAGLLEMQRGQFDLLVLDLQMPVMDGRAMFREVRASGSSIPVLVLSAFGAESARSELGAEAALAKPFDIDTLIVRITSLVAPRGE